MKKKSSLRSAFFTPHVLTTLVVCAAACFIVPGSLLAFLHHEAPTNIITVTNTNDSGPGSLRQALADANDGDTIEFAVTGTIGLTSGELLVNNSITISGPAAATLAVNGNANGRVFHVAPGITVTISGLTITNGNACCIFPDDVGGGIYNDHATLTLNACIISGNVADNRGGGIFSDGSFGSASVAINDSEIINNSTFSGGAIFSDGNSGTALLEITGTIISENSATETGGAISNDHAHVTLNNCTMSFNSAGGNGGGAIYNLGNTFNSKKGDAVVEINNSTLSGNSAQFNGGGIYSDGVAMGTAQVQIVNSTLSGNSATSNGGGIYNSGGLGSATLQIGNSTLADNSAQSFGGSIYNFGLLGKDATTDLANTIFTVGTAGGTISNSAGTITSEGYNLSSDDGGGYLTGPGDQINTDPVLGPLQDNGGPTFTHALLPGSPAINAGDPSFTPPPLFDQRGPGFDRVVNGRIDKGSFEVQGPTPTVTPTPTATPTPTPTGTPSSTPRATPTPRPRPTPARRPNS
jgi:hypothetical protein